jgi:hypothetical protein
MMHWGGESQEEIERQNKPEVKKIPQSGPFRTIIWSNNKKEYTLTLICAVGDVSGLPLLCANM